MPLSNGNPLIVFHSTGLLSLHVDMSTHVPVTRPRDETVCAKNPEAVIQGPEMGRVLWGYAVDYLDPWGREAG